MTTASAAIAQPRAVRTPARRSGAYAGLGLLIVVLVIGGFWPQYFSPLVRGAQLQQLLWHCGFALHATVSLGWLLAFALQAALVWRGHVKLHRRIGPALAVYAVVVAVVDFYAGLQIEVHRVALGETVERAAAFAFLVVRDVVMFAAFVAPAIAYRRKPSVHKRLMFLGTMSLAMIGTGRLVGRYLLPDHENWFPIVCSTPILLAMTYDWRSERRVHPILVVGLLLFLLRLKYLNFNFGMTSLWQPIGRALLQPFL